MRGRQSRGQVRTGVRPLIPTSRGLWRAEPFFHVFSKQILSTPGAWAGSTERGGRHGPPEAAAAVSPSARAWRWPSGAEERGGRDGPDCDLPRASPREQKRTGPTGSPRGQQRPAQCHVTARPRATPRRTLPATERPLEL